MKNRIHLKILLATFFIATVSYMSSCTHDDEIFSPSGAANIQRGTDVVKNSEGWTFDKSHSNVMWETAYMGSAAMLTGRFNMFGISNFSFDEANPANTSFEAWVRLNTVNTGEFGRDGNATTTTGCIQTTFGTAAGKIDEPENLAIIKSKSVELSKTDKGYLVKMDLTFKGVTKEVTGKLIYTGKTRIAAATPYDLAGFTLEFQFFAKTDYGVVSTNIADKVAIKTNAQFKKS
jgi:polyisoprenoid-binding protein YceI